MTLWHANVVAYSIQLMALVMAGVTAAAVLRLRHSLSVTCFWHTLFVGAVVLPLVQPWVPAPADGAVARFAHSVTATPVLAERHVSWGSAVSVVLLAGVAVKLAWLSLGLFHLRRLRVRSTPLSRLPIAHELQVDLGTRADVRLSDDVAGPVTFGIRRPTILLPSRVAELPTRVLRAALCHEFLHVRRRDWLWTMAEAAWCAVLWFHPAARALVDRSSLAREIRVDDEVIAYTGDRRAYAAALLAFSGGTARPLAVATPFFGRRHLSERIERVTREFPMHADRSRITLGIAIVVVTSAVVLATSQAPLARTTMPGLMAPAASRNAQPPAAERPGGDIVAPRVVHSEKPAYTPEALAAKIQGSVFLELVVLESGTVGRVDVIKSLDEVHGLDDAARDAASRWTFEPGTKDGTPVPVIITLEMTFTLKD